MKTLEIITKHGNNVLVIVLKGLLNADTSPGLEKTLIDVVEQESKPQILLDMKELTYISSAGIGCFIGVIKRIRVKQGDLRFCSLDSKVMRVFNLLDMADFFQFFETQEEGVKSF